MIIAFIIIALLAGGVITWVVSNTLLKSRSQTILKEAESEAKALKEKKMYEAKEKYLTLKNEYEVQVNQRNARIQQTESRLKQRESQLNQQHSELQKQRAEVENTREKLSNQLEIVEKRKQDLDKVHRQAHEQLEVISGYSAQEAKEKLMESLKEVAKTDAMSYINEIMEEAKMTANKEAKRVVVQTIQRIATEAAVENSVTVFNIDSDELKGRIIGREGRNIRALEAATGVEIIVDDTPEAIVLSAFDPVRREIARLALHQLVIDGRIHPARIEEVVSKVKKQVEDEIVETGKRTTIDLGVHGLHPELIRLIGKMKYAPLPPRSTGV